MPRTTMRNEQRPNGQPGSNADAGYKLARSFRCILLIEFKAQFHRAQSAHPGEMVNKSSKSKSFTV